MGVPDHGGFDLVIALDVAKLDALIRPVVNQPIGEQTSNVPNWGTLRVRPVVQLAGITLAPNGAITLTITTAGTTLQWPAGRVGGVQIFPAGSAELNVTVSVTGRPEGVGTELRVAFASDAAQVTIAPGTLEAIPAIQGILAAVDIVGSAQDVENTRTAIYRAVTDGLENGLNVLIPSTVRLGRLPRPPVTAVETAASGTELRFLMTIGGTRGNPAAITRSRINRTGAPGDLAAVIVNNDCLLRDIIRPALRAGFGLTNAGFVSGHPCFWAGSVSFPAAATFGITPRLRSVRAGIDAAGMLRVLVSLDGEHSTGAFGLEGSFDLGFGASVVQNGANRELRLTVSNGGSFVRSIDIWVAWWVYVGGIFVSPLLTLALALTDAFAGGGLASGINSALRGAVSQIPMTLPIPDGPLSLSGLSLSQPDAPLRTFTIPGLPITFSDFPRNDAIVRFSA